MEDKDFKELVEDLKQGFVDDGCEALVVVGYFPDGTAKMKQHVYGNALGLLNCLAALAYSLSKNISPELVVSSVAQGVNTEDVPDAF